MFNAEPPFTAMILVQAGDEMRVRMIESRFVTHNDGDTTIGFTIQYGFGYRREDSMFKFWIKFELMLHTFRTILWLALPKDKD